MLGVWPMHIMLVGVISHLGYIDIHGEYLLTGGILAIANYYHYTPFFYKKNAH